MNAPAVSRGGRVRTSEASRKRNSFLLFKPLTAVLNRRAPAPRNQGAGVPPGRGRGQEVS